MKSHRLLPLVAAGFLLLGLSDTASAQVRVDRNVVYGMYSGTALLLDVHYPAKPNGFGVIFIPGSGWSAPLGYAAPPLKESDQVGMYVPSLTEAGYTVSPSPIGPRPPSAIRRSSRTRSVPRASCGPMPRSTASIPLASAGPAAPRGSSGEHAGHHGRAGRRERSRPRQP